MKKNAFNLAMMVFSLVFVCGFSACAKEKCGLCEEEHSKLSMREGFILGQEMLICEDCYEEIKNMWD